jgi:vancomycin resistance protein YoaR
MPDKYYQEYGPIRRRRDAGTLHSEDASSETPPHRPVKTTPAVDSSRATSQLNRRAQRAPKQRGQAKSFFGGLFRLLLLTACVVGAFYIYPYVSRIISGEHAIDGVSIAGEPVGGKNRSEIRAVLDQRYRSFVRAPITISYEGRTWEPTLEQLGASFDLDQVTNDILATGHRGNPIVRTQELWQIWQNNGYDVAPRMSIDMRKLQSFLASLASTIEQPPRDAALNIAEGRALPTSAATGTQVLIDETAKQIVQSLQTLQPQQLTLQTRELTPLITTDSMAKAYEDALALLEQPLRMHYADKEWFWDTERIASVIEVQRGENGLETTVSEEKLARAVEKLAQTIDSPSSEPRVAFRNGQPQIVAEGQIGWRVKQEEAIAAIKQTLESKGRDLELPMEEVSPNITAETLPTLGIVELVGEGRSSYAGSAEYRITNIKAGAVRMDGVLIAPGEEFSFNRQLGEVDEANGFVQGYAIIGNSTQLEWGGGVCQDSTTVFRAAFWAGLPITERHTHAFYINWYDAYSFPDQAGPGMDAAIYTGVSDLKFVNDTGNWLLMEAIADDSTQTLTVRLYGTKPNRQVYISGPHIDNRVPPPSQPVYLSDATLPSGTIKQTDTSRAGMDIVVYRTIVEDGVELESEVFFTRFKAWPDVYVRGTG